MQIRLFLQTTLTITCGVGGKHLRQDRSGNRGGYAQQLRMETREILLLLTLGLPLIGTPFVALAGRKSGTRAGWFALAFPIISTASLLGLAAGSNLPGQTVIEWPWIPSLGIQLSFLVDGLSVFFGLMVSGVGCLVFFYAIHYLGDKYPHQGRFYCYLVLFMAAMLGTVLANNLMVLFVFWELTGLASFLLIGFLHEEKQSRTGARQALLVTSLTGLAMLAGFVMIYTVTGTYDFAEIVSGGLPFAEHKTWLTVALGLVALGAFGKSAQFPFQFWLPGAMAAPTPVSAYLHSATMVKLGVFLCARFFPLFVESDLWAPLLGVVAFGTMVLGAVLALLSHDLKAILAYSTVSQLGFLIGYYGLGSRDGVQYDYLHILNHVFYKGCLFMVAGIVAHAAGIRDIRQLGGLFRRMPFLGVTTLVATATMAGLPGTTGFLSKEMVLKDIFEATKTHGPLGWYAAVCVIAGSIVKVAFSARIFANIFLGRETSEVKKNFHAQPLCIQLPPAILAGCALLFGVGPALLEPLLNTLTVEGLNRSADLKLWHGFTKELFASSAIVALGFGVYWLGERTRWRSHEVPRWLEFGRLFEAGMERFSTFTKSLTRVLRADQPLDYLPIIIGFTALLVGGCLLWQFGFRIPNSEFEASLHPLRSFVAGLIALAVIGVMMLKRWTTQLISISVVGFLICFYFVLYRAPDLALTQILIEVVGLFMILLLLARFPRSAETGETSHRNPRWRNALNAVIALGAGATVTVFVLAVNSDPYPSRIGSFFLENTKPLAEGSNAVNTILVDFRGFDTLGEITVLVVAMLGAVGLLMRYKRSPEEYREGPMGPPGFGIEAEEHDIEERESGSRRSAGGKQ